ncbi:MAG: hypothetical protein CM15mP44_1550 [Candidatus Neomarinimicrobiota bacterium]|nr:MAG: hypothetical protein CM15mP44_1550 [Candidatus Neomarinimicrobiota bacterium]
MTKNGSLQFIEFESIFLNQNKKLAVESLSTFSNKIEYANWDYKF